MPVCENPLLIAGQRRLHEEPHGGHQEAHHGKGSKHKRVQSYTQGEIKSTHGQKHGHEHGHGHEENTEGEMGSTIGQMLLGSMTVQMCIFYLVNHTDQDIQRYAWIIIGTTISIFCAVLTFQAVLGFLERLGLAHEKPDIGHLVVSHLHFLLWFLAMQFVIFHTSISANAVRKTVQDTHGGRRTRARSSVTLESVERSAIKASVAPLCWGGLYAHISAFAAIVGWSQIQACLLDAIGPVGVWITPVIAFIFLGTLSLIATRIRNNEPDKDVVFVECENDMIALPVSLMLAHCVGFLIEGSEHLPGEHHVVFHSKTQIVVIIAVSLVFAVIMYCLIQMEERRREASEGVKRAFEVAQVTFSFVFAWCLLTGMTWGIRGVARKAGWTHIYTCIVEAIVVSIGSVSVIFCFDKVSDHMKDQKSEGKETSPELDRFILDMIGAFGVLIGFSWEHAFNLAVEDMSMQYETVMGHQPFWSPPSYCFRFGLCVFICGIVFPAFTLYIAPRVFHLKEEQEHKRQSQSGEHRLVSVTADQDFR